ncbi:hypothetical protein RsTz2092_10210 [Deferribacterales bacterium RsTz2092]
MFVFGYKLNNAISLGFDYIVRKIHNNKLAKKIVDIDVVASLSGFYRSIPTEYIKSFWVVFIGVNTAFAFYLFFFWVGNHAWEPYLDGLELGTYSSGRPIRFLLTYYLLDGHILPVISPLLIHLLVSLAAIMCCVYWRIPRSVSTYSLIGLLFVLSPFTAISLYYPEVALSFSRASFSMVLALLLSWRAVTADSPCRKYLLTGVSAILILTSVMSYQSGVETLIVVFIAKVIIDVICDWNVTLNGLKKLVSSYIYLFIATILAAVCYAGYLWITREMLGGGYTDPTAPYQMLLNFFGIMNKNFGVLLGRIFEPFFTSHITSLLCWLSLISLVSCLVYIWTNTSQYKNKLIKTLTIAVLVVFLFVLSSLSTLITSWHIGYREYYFGLRFVFAFIPVLVFMLPVKKIVRSVTVVLVVLLVWAYAVQDVLITRIWHDGLASEKNMWFAVRARIEAHPNFNKDAKYRLMAVGTGGYTGHRQFYYFGHEPSKGELANVRSGGDGSYSNMISEPINMGTVAPLLFHLGPTVHITQSCFLPNPYESSGYCKQLAEELRNDIASAKPYPDKSSVVVSGDKILVVISK